MVDISALFEHYGWSYVIPEPNLWQSAFFTERDEEFDLYVMVVEDWVYFAVAPFLPPAPPAQMQRVLTSMLKLNQQMRIVHFALDGDGDPALLADAPVRQLTDVYFALILEAFVFYTERLAGELGRMALDPGYFSPLVPG